MLMYVTCFSVSDLFHSLLQSLGPSMSLQMTQCPSFLWLSNITLYIRTTSLSVSLAFFCLVGFFVIFLNFLLFSCTIQHCGILVPQSGIEPTPPALEA